jgi:hypothetical protein
MTQVQKYTLHLGLIFFSLTVTVCTNNELPNAPAIYPEIYLFVHGFGIWCSVT